MGYDLLVKNGTVIDGSGSPGYRADVMSSMARLLPLDVLTKAPSEPSMRTDTSCRPDLSTVIPIWMLRFFGTRSVPVLAITGSLAW